MATNTEHIMLQPSLQNMDVNPSVSKSHLCSRKHDYYPPVLLLKRTAVQKQTERENGGCFWITVTFILSRGHFVFPPASVESFEDLISVSEPFWSGAEIRDHISCLTL